MDGYKFFPDLIFTAFFMLGLFTQTMSSNHLASPCDVIGCLCSDNAIVGSNVTCSVKAVSNKSKIIRSLQSKRNIKYLTFKCNTLPYKSHLDQNLLTRFPELEYLSLDACVVDTLHPAFISNISNFQELSFQKITFTTSDISLLSKTLKSLTIIDSVLPKFPNMFDCPALETVTMAHNKVLDPSLMPLAKNGTILGNLKKLSLIGNGIKHLPSTMFKFYPSLVEIQLSQNLIRDISFSPDSDLSDLEIINGLENPLEFLDTRALISSNKLRWLRMHGVGQEIDLEFLSHLQNLVDLQLSNFNLNSSIWDLLRCPSLERLDLSHNHLTSFNVSALPSLRVLLLQCNAIIHLPNDAFLEQTGLEGLNLTQNKIEFVPESIFENNQILKLVAFTSNAIRNLPRKIFSTTTQLFYIHLTNTSLKTLPDEIFMSLHNLKFLYLDNNELESFPLFPYPCALTHLFISNNSISSLKLSHFHLLNNLLILQMDFNHIEWIPSELLWNCTQLLQVSFANNRIQGVGSFGNHASIEQLYFDNNLITFFSSFSEMKNLRGLSMDNNYITKIPPFSFPKSIRILSLSFNFLEYIRRDAFSNLPFLEFVDIKGNRRPLSIPTAALSSFSKNVVKPSFNFENSLLSCDCLMGYIKVWLTENQYENIDWEFRKFYPKFIGLEKTYCVSEYFPGEKRSVPETPLDHFVCNFTVHPYCDYKCNCCPRKTGCYCYLTCPVKCQCYGGGSMRQEFLHSVRCDRIGLTSIPSDIHSFVSQLLLDGNYFDTISNTSFTNLTQVRELNLNGSHISTIEDGAFDNMSSLVVLRLNDNRIERISSNTFGNISTLRHLYLNQNRIQAIEMSAFDFLTSLEILYLDTNELLNLGPILSLPSLTAVTLAFNPWSCTCADGWDTIRYLVTISSIVVDRNNVCCDTTIPTNFSRSDYFTSIENRIEFSRTQSPVHSLNRDTAKGLNTEKFKSDSQTLLWVTGNYTDAFNRSGNGALDNDTCYQLLMLDLNLLCTVHYNESVVQPVGSSDFVTAEQMPLLISLAIFLALVGVAVVLLLWKGNIVQAWLYSKAGIRILDKKAAADREDKSSKPFDAFISFSHKDVAYVVNTLVPALEDKRYRLCVHHRDFPVGGDICTVVGRAIKYSSRTILVVSPHFLKSDWCRYEFKTAHHHVLQEGCHRLILVILGDLPQKEIDPDLQVQLKTKTYLKSDDPWFWEKLLFALPDITGRREGDDENTGRALKGMEILSQDADDIDLVLKHRLNNDDYNNGADNNHDEDYDKRDGRIDWENGAFELHEDEIRMEPWWGNVAEI